MPENIKHRLKILMQKYLDRTCTLEERDELVRMISKTSGPEEVNDLWRETWAKTDGLVQYDELSWEALQEINVSERRKSMKIVWKKALKWSAVAAVLMGVYFMVDWVVAGEDILIYETGYGETLEIVLDDGTMINLNADSKLTWDKKWTETGVRQVMLEGEAYFDVSHIESSDKTNQVGRNSTPYVASRMPFEVLTSDVTIRVLGTAFNTTQRRGKTEVYLERGAVELSLHQNDIQNNRKSVNRERRALQKQKSGSTKSGEILDTLKLVRMQPGDWVSYSAEDDVLVQKTPVGGEEKTEWKDGVLSYHDVEFRVMLQNLEDIYGKSFDVGDQNLLDKRVNFGVPFKDWDTVTEMMEMMLEIEITEQDNHRVNIKNGRTIDQ